MLNAKRPKNVPSAVSADSGVWHKFRLLYPRRPIQTLALFAKPRRVLEYGKKCRFLRRPHSQPQPVQALQASHNRHACFLFVVLSTMIDVSSFTGASQNGKQLPYSKTRVRVCKIVSLDDLCQTPWLPRVAVTNGNGHPRGTPKVLRTVKSSRSVPAPDATGDGRTTLPYRGAAPQVTIAAPSPSHWLRMLRAPAVFPVSADRPGVLAYHFCL